MEVKQDYILNLIQKNQKKGLKLLFEQYFKPLCLHAVKIVGELVIAEDLVQDIFVRFWELNTYENIKGNLRGYLYTSVKRQCYEYLRKREKQPLDLYDNLPTYMSLEEADYLKKEELTERIYKAIEELPPRTKEAFKAVFINQMKYKEAAKELEISVNSIKTLLSKATQKLRETFKNEILLILILIFF